MANLRYPTCLNHFESVYRTIHQSVSPDIKILSQSVSPPFHASCLHPNFCHSQITIFMSKNPHEILILAASIIIVGEFPHFSHGNHSPVGHPVIPIHLVLRPASPDQLLAWSRPLAPGRVGAIFVRRSYEIWLKRPAIKKNDEGSCNVGPPSYKLVYKSH